MKLEDDDIAKNRAAPEKPCLFTRDVQISSKADLFKKRLPIIEANTQKSTGPSSAYETTESTKRSSGLAAVHSGTGTVLTSGAEFSKVAGTFSPKNYLFRIERNRKLFNVLNYSTKDCPMCCTKKSYDSIVYKNLSKKYVSTRDSYNVKLINDIIYNEPTHIVSIFKDFLIYDDTSEFCKRYYERYESTKRIKIQTLHQAKYSKVFPNYFQLEVKDCMFKNIRKKQKAIDKRNEEMEAEYLSEMESKLFTTGFVEELDKTDSILGKTLRMLKDSETTLMQSYIKTQEALKGGKGAPQGKAMEDMNLQELVEKFISKDSISFASVSIQDNSISIVKQDAKVYVEPQKENDKMTANRFRSKSRNANYYDSKIAGTKPQQAKIKTKEILIDTKINSVRESHNRALNDKKPIPLILTSRSKSTGKFLMAQEEKLRYPQTSRQKQIQGQSQEPHRALSPEKKLDREKIADIQATVAQMLEKNKGREHMRRSKSGFSGDCKPAFGQDAQAKNRQRTASIVKRIEGKIDLKLRAIQTPTTTSRLHSDPKVTLVKAKEGFLTNRNNAPTYRASTASINGPITSIASANTVVSQKPPRNDPVRRSCKGLAIDIESINKCLQKQKVAIQEAKTLKTTRAHTSKTPSEGKFRSDYLNALKNHQARPGAANPNLGETGTKQGQMVIDSIKSGAAATRKRPAAGYGVPIGESKVSYNSSGSMKVADIIAANKSHNRRKSGADSAAQRYIHHI